MREVLEGTCEALEGTCEALEGTCEVISHVLFHMSCRKLLDSSPRGLPDMDPLG